MTDTLNPHLLTTPVPGVVTLPPPAAPRTVYAKLPRAPLTGSPVPELTSLWHDDDPGPWGSRAYPGNCSGGLIHALLRYYRPESLYDPLTGSGTCRAVCADLGIRCYANDIHFGFDACEPHFDREFAFCWIHPPYARMKRYSPDERDLSREATLAGFLARYEQLLRSCARALIPGGHLAVLMGDYTDREWGYVPLVHHTKVLAFRLGLRQEVTDIVRFSHGASSGRKAYRRPLIPGLHDICVVFTKPDTGTEGV